MLCSIPHSSQVTATLVRLGQSPVTRQGVRQISCYLCHLAVTDVEDLNSHLFIPTALSEAVSGLWTLFLVLLERDNSIYP